MSSKQSQLIDIKATIKCLQNMINKQQDEAQKAKLINIVRAIQKNQDKKELQRLNPVHQKWFVLLKEAFNVYRQSFQELIKQTKFKIVLETQFNIVEHLLQIQTLIGVTKETVTVENIISKYTVANLRLRKRFQSWPKDFLAEWTGRAKEKMKKPEPKKNQQPNDDDSSENDLPPPTTLKPVKIQRQPQRKPIIDTKPRRPEPTRADNSRQVKDRVSSIENYLALRKDLTLTNSKLKEISQYLTPKFQLFMKKAIQRIIDIASLKNKRNKFGNQLGYFAEGSGRMAAQMPFYMSPSSKICAVFYKHKLQLYSTLRSKELKKEEDLRTALETKTNQSEKKIDKRIQNYILKPRPKQVQPVEIFRQEKDLNKPIPNSLAIYSEHVLHYLETHPFLRNSLLLFNGYHY